MLWDVLGTTWKPGGAPMNVAYHLSRLGVASRMISSVGKDEKGDRLRAIIEKWGLASDTCQTDALHATSEVIARMDPDGEVQYEILFPVAWDFITLEETCLQHVQSSDAFVFGSLAMRHIISEGTLLQLLEAAHYRVFDVNLRKPHFRPSRVLDVLGKTDLLKVNQAELEMISHWIDPGLTGEPESVALLQDRFGIREVIVTKGDRGAAYYTPEYSFEQPAYKVRVADTVGSGDAFLAAFLAGKFEKGVSVNQRLSYAAALGAFVAAREGACPEYDRADIREFMTNAPA